MQAAIKNITDGSVALKLDADAAGGPRKRLFAARFHEGISPLARMAKEELERDNQNTTRRGEPCR